MVLDGLLVAGRALHFEADDENASAPDNADAPEHAMRPATPALRMPPRPGRQAAHRRRASGSDG